MKILLTGASGFLGKNFLKFSPKEMQITGLYSKSGDIVKFVEENSLNNVTLHRCDLTNKDDVIKLFNKIGNKFDYCVYLAGNVDVSLSIKDPLKDLDINAAALINFLSSVKSIGRFIYMSTAGVYDGNQGKVTVKTNLHPTIPYCISKLACEYYIKFFKKIGAIGNYVIIRFSGAFGPYSKEFKFIAKVVEDIYIKNKKVIEVYGDGKNKINVVYSKDLVDALTTCLKSKKSDITVNLGHNNMTIKEAVEKIAKILDKKVLVKTSPKRKDQKYIHFEYDSDFNEVFGFKPRHSFEAGLRELAKFYKNKNER